MNSENQNLHIASYHIFPSCSISYSSKWSLGETMFPVCLEKNNVFPRYWCQMLHTSSPQNAEVLLSFSGNSQNREKQPLFWCFTICITWLCVRVSLNLSGKHLRVCVWPSLFAQYVTLHSLSQKLPLPSIPEISLFDTYQAKPNPYVKTTLYGPLNFYPLSHLLSHPTEFPSPFPGTVTNK